HECHFLISSEVCDQLCFRLPGEGLLHHALRARQVTIGYIRHHCPLDVCQVDRPEFHQFVGTCHGLVGTSEVDLGTNHRGEHQGRAWVYLVSQFQSLERLLVVTRSECEDRGAGQGRDVLGLEFECTVSEA